jgi:hypothetical protein
LPDLNVGRNVVEWGAWLLGYCPEPSVEVGHKSSVGGEEGAEDAMLTYVGNVVYEVLTYLGK